MDSDGLPIVGPAVDLTKARFDMKFSMIYNVNVKSSFNLFCFKIAIKLYSCIVLMCNKYPLITFPGNNQSLALHV